MVRRSELTGCVKIQWNSHEHCAKCSNHNSQLQKQLSCYIPLKAFSDRLEPTAEAMSQDMPPLDDIFMQLNQSMAPATSEALIDSNDKVFAAMLQTVTVSVARCFGDERWGCGAS